jgi:hypothetical protein
MVHSPTPLKNKQKKKHAAHIHELAWGNLSLSLVSQVQL